METVLLDVLRAPEMQRLRRIHQMGLANFVFPGAEHSRWVHSLGAAHLAIRLCRALSVSARECLSNSLCPGDGSVRDLALAALFHDLGHGPLSHAWEREIVGRDYDFQSWAHALGVDDEVQFLQQCEWHEMVTYALLKWEDGQLHKLLEEDSAGLSKRLRRMLRGDYYLTYLPRLLSSDIDVDRADYLRRDSYQCGVDYGRYDFDRLLSSIRLGKTTDRRIVIGFEERKAARAVEQFLRARRDLYEIVYHHKTVRCAEGMLGMFLRRMKALVRDGKRFDVDRFVEPYVRITAGEQLTLHELLSLDDYSLWVLIDNVSNAKEADATLADLGKRILSRELFKIVPCDPSDVAEFLQEEGAYESLHEVIEPFCPGKREYYIIKDDVSFDMFSEPDREKGYFINESQTAEPFLHHPMLPDLPTRKLRYTRLFTLREATDVVARMIENRVGRRSPRRAQ